MNRIKFLKLTLLSLVLFAYQLNISHLQHLTKKDTTCKICLVNKSIGSASHQISFILDTNILDSTEIQKKILKKTRLTAISNPAILKHIDFSGMRNYKVDKIPLGYYSHAPPYNYS